MQRPATCRLCSRRSRQPVLLYRGKTLCTRCTTHLTTAGWHQRGAAGGAAAARVRAGRPKPSAPKLARLPAPAEASRSARAQPARALANWERSGPTVRVRSGGAVPRYRGCEASPFAQRARCSCSCAVPALVEGPPAGGPPVLPSPFSQRSLFQDGTALRACCEAKLRLRPALGAPDCCCARRRRRRRTS